MKQKINKLQIMHRHKHTYARLKLVYLCISDFLCYLLRMYLVKYISNSK